MSDLPWLSIVTVVKDASTELQRTLTSLQTQDLNGVEYIVIDSSSDLQAVPALLHASQLAHQYSWQPADGIYAAMNEGLNKAQGKYIYFLNAGDEALPGAIADVAEFSGRGEANWVIGLVEVVSASGGTVISPPWLFAAEQEASFARGSFAPHQGTFARREDLRAIGGFDTTYRIAADYAAFLSLTKLSEPKMLNSAVARFHEGGLSTQRWQDSFKEFHRARKEILNPRGTTAVLEVFYTVRQFAAVGIYRGFWSKVVGK